MAECGYTDGIRACVREPDHKGGHRDWQGFFGAPASIPSRGLTKKQKDTLKEVARSARPVEKSPLIDHEEAHRRAREGMSRAGTKATAEEKDAMADAIVQVALHNQYVYSDLIWEHLGRIPDHGLASALGPLMKNAAKAGIIERAGELETGRPTQHRRIIRGWKSLVYGVVL